MKIVLAIVKLALAVFFSSTILAVVAYRFIPVYVTPLMVILSASSLGRKHNLASSLGEP